MTHRRKAWVNLSLAAGPCAEEACEVGYSIRGVGILGADPASRRITVRAEGMARP